MTMPSFIAVKSSAYVKFRTGVDTSPETVLHRTILIINILTQNIYVPVSAVYRCSNKSSLH